MPVIEGISVILPGKSTAILPDDWPVNSGHPTGMDLEAILRRIEQRLAALNMKADKASRLGKANDAIRNIRRAVKDGVGGVTVKTITKLAVPLETTPAWLLGQDSTPPLEELDLDQLYQEREASYQRIGRIQAIIDSKSASKSVAKRRRTK